MDLKWYLESLKRDRALTEEERALAEALSDEYSRWIQGLSSKEMHAIRKYTKNSLKENKRYSFFVRLNQMLEDDHPELLKEYHKLSEYADIISAAIRKHALQRDITCYRGVNDIPVQGIEVGEVFRYKRFISTSLFKKHAFKCRYLMIIHVPKGTNAAYIDDISVYKGQYEVLIDKGYCFRLLSVKGNVYEMEVCDYD